MGYRIDFANDQYRAHGAQVCLHIDERLDIEPDEIDDIIMIARDEVAIVDDDGEAFVVQLPGRPQEVYTEEALRRSLKPFLLQAG